MCAACSRQSGSPGTSPPCTLPAACDACSRHSVAGRLCAPLQTNLAEWPLLLTSLHAPLAGHPSSYRRCAVPRHTSSWASTSRRWPTCSAPTGWMPPPQRRGCAPDLPPSTGGLFWLLSTLLAHDGMRFNPLCPWGWGTGMCCAQLPSLPAHLRRPHPRLLSRVTGERAAPARCGGRQEACWHGQRPSQEGVCWCAAGSQLGS